MVVPIRHLTGMILVGSICVQLGPHKCFRKHSHSTFPVRHMCHVAGCLVRIEIDQILRQYALERVFLFGMCVKERVVVKVVCPEELGSLLVHTASVIEWIASCEVGMHSESVQATTAGEWFLRLTTSTSHPIYKGWCRIYKS